MKKVALVPSGPTKLKTPPGSFPAAAWTRRVVLAGTVDVQEIVVQVAEFPGAGFASLADETKSPDDA